ncbi:hypothetical protein DJ568_05015 [Mucilaginibacter hurinus]|uniref:VCBS repeat-containing protein n=1 Tax=Mucilaginibacter hurinus TaxID=2201324 RepID=A0A367GSI7_9SPHI|nr:hypothetical protein [Mucilaginibacter hurinus]RCH56108.1 hypothetical protein DJ568_05015 [Mucilaginibacter hurinus]
MKIKYCLFLLAGGLVVAGCGGNEGKVIVNNNTKIIKPPAVQAPFRYHKYIEVAPGNAFDVLSWGRGAAKVGAFMILHSDSSSLKYTTTTGDLEGAIMDVYNADMDLDGNPELLIHANSDDTLNFTRIYPFEFNGDKANKLNFPDLTKKQKRGYRGKDNFYIKEGKFMREFPIYGGEGNTAKLSGAKRVLQYGLRNNSFTVEQISKDSTDKDDGAVTPVKEEKKAVADKPSNKKSSSNKSKRRKRN